MHNKVRGCAFHSDNIQCEQRHEIGSSIVVLGYDQSGTAATGFTPSTTQTILKTTVFHPVPLPNVFHCLNIWVLIGSGNVLHVTNAVLGILLLSSLRICNLSNIHWLVAKHNQFSVVYYSDSINVTSSAIWWLGGEMKPKIVHSTFTVLCDTTWMQKYNSSQNFEFAKMRLCFMKHTAKRTTALSAVRVRDCSSQEISCTSGFLTRTSTRILFSIQSTAGVAEKSISHYHRHSAWQSTELWRVYRDSGMMETDGAPVAYGDQGRQRWTASRGVYIRETPGSISCIASCILYQLISLYKEFHILSFLSFDLTRSVWHFVDPPGRVVSFLLTLFLQSSSQNCSFSRSPVGMPW